MKKGLWIGIVVVMLGIAYIMLTKRQSQELRHTFVIGINQFMQHPLLDDVYRGIIDGLKEVGVSEQNGSTIILKNANGDQNVAFQINKQFVDRKVDMIIPIATPSAQSACKVTKDIPIVFAAITDPVSAGIADSLERPGGNKTGTSDRWPYEKQIELIRELLPKAVTVGIILNPGESNTEASMNFIRPALKKFNFKKIEVPVSSTMEVYGAAKSLVGRCNVILVPADNTVVGAFEAVVKVANDNCIPLFAGNTPCVEKGAIATYGVNYYKIGCLTGKLSAQILKQHLNAGAISVVVESEADLVINLKAAKIQKVPIPEEIIKSAAQIFK